MSGTAIEHSGSRSQVTRVGRGEKLGESVGALPFEDMTVEDLLRIVRGLPPEESAINAVARGLYYLDSRALAALLKELAKVCGLHGWPCMKVLVQHDSTHASSHRH